MRDGSGDNGDGGRSIDPLQLYLREIRETPLLSPGEEIELARKIAKGDEQARKQMIKANLRLVVAIAKRDVHLGLVISDLIEEGNLGLMKAVERYDPEKGFRFSTYASWWIRQSITRALANQGKLIRIPIYMTELLQKYRRVSDEMQQQSKSKEKPDMRQVAKQMKITVEKVYPLEELSLMPASLDMRLGDDGVGQLLDVVEDRLAVSPAREMERIIRQERVEGALAALREREAQVLRLRYGLQDGQPRTLEETGGQLGLTRERIRQIEVVALKKLRDRMRRGDGKSAPPGRHAGTARKPSRRVRPASKSAKRRKDG